MFIAEIIGTVITSQKTDNMDGLPLRIVRKIATNAEQIDSYAVAVDVIGVSEGEYVLVSSGSSARQTHLTDARPCDSIIFAIVDTWQTENIVRYTKDVL